ncbi:MAG: VOC family protein [Pseudomonadota bacterium]
MAKPELDHFVFACGDVEASQLRFERRFDEKLHHGGAHPGRGTRNKLGGLSANSGDRVYMEILGPDFDQANPTNAFDALAEDTLFHWAVRSDDLGAIEKAAEACGFGHDGVVHGERTQTDGSKLEWRLLFLREHDAGAAVPFFIDWGRSPHPSTTLKPVAEFNAFCVETPHAEQITSLFKSIGADFDVVDSSVSRLALTLETHGDEHVFATQSPFPLGLS